MVRKIAVFSGSRGEYGYIRPVMQELLSRGRAKLTLIVSGMHTEPTFGETFREFERDGFTIDHLIRNTGPERSPASSIEDLGALLSTVAGVLAEERPDIVLLSGDRREQLIVAIAAASLGLAVAHIQGGELSGHFDGVFRHAISRIAHIHFVANELCARRVRALGEHAWRIHVVGAPQLDEIVEGRFSTPEEVLPRYGLFARSYLVALLHPCARDSSPPGEVARHLQAVLDEWLSGDPARRVVWIASNNDPEHGAIRAVLDKLEHPCIVVPSLPRSEFLTLLGGAAGIVGNSSCGILEAPSLGVPALNIGQRQKNRQHSDNALHVGTSIEELRGGLARLPGLELGATDNPYYRPGSAAAIADVLENIELTETLLAKQYEDPLAAAREERDGRSSS
jgi:UDP-hydrolysing UDP-N-acetyl-D-glucosamine 2-epimerase